jgi:hypothetical protein
MRLRGDFEEELGAQPPLGFWDPLGLLEKADEQRFQRLRAVHAHPYIISQNNTSIVLPICIMK